MAREVRVAILGDSRDFSRAVASASGDARRLDRSFSGIGSSAMRMGKAAAIGLGGLAAGGAVLAKGFYDAAIESQKVTKQTEAVLKSMGDGANVTAQQVAKLSETLSMQTGIDDELIQSGQNVLLTFGKLRNGTAKTDKVFDRATEAALNMSVALGTDMKSASMMVGKALNDPIRGLTALRRSGIQFTKQQEDQIKKMVEAGNVMGAQKVMLKELEAQFGGSAKAQATAGEKLKVVWGNLQEQIGAKLIPVVEKAATWLAGHLPAALDTLGRVLGPVAEQVGDFFRALASGKTEDEGTPVERFALKVRDAGIAVAEFVKDKLSQLREWWDTHGPAITTAVKGFAEDFQSYVLAPLGDLATFIDEKVLPALGRFITWVLEHRGALQAFGVLVGVALVAHFGALAVAAVTSAVASIAAWTAAVGPIALMIGFVAALAAITTWAVNTRGFANLLQWGIDMADAVWDLVNAIGVVEPKLRALVNLAKGAGGLLPDLPGGPREAKINPLTGLPATGRTSSGVPGGTSRAQGGWVPGALNQPRLILAHGGEFVSTHGRQMRGGGEGVPTQIIIQTGADPQAVVEAIKRYTRANGPLPNNLVA